jgi:acyl-CoA dehydrogenase
MNTTVVQLDSTQNRDWLAAAQTLGRGFAERAEAYDRSGEFVVENYRELRGEKFFSAGIPEELGGGGVSHQQLCAIVQEFGRHCGATALAFAMHTHPVSMNVFKFMRGDAAAEKTLRKLAADELVIAGTGANDWLASSGEAKRVDGGYRVSARKRFVSGSAGAHVFVTSAGHEGEAGREVLHFAVPFAADGVTIVDTWDTLGMRATGSHDVTLDDVFVADEAIVVRRPAGVWHPMWDAILPTALPLITAAYVGQAETAAELAVSAAANNRLELSGTVGEMLNALTTAQIALREMVGVQNDYAFTPSAETTDRILTCKTIAAEAVKQCVEVAADLVGGPGYFRGHALERIVRDIRAMHFHPLPIKRQQAFSGRLALGLDPITGEA